MKYDGGSGRKRNRCLVSFQEFHTHHGRSASLLLIESGYAKAGIVEHITIQFAVFRFDQSV